MGLQYSRELRILVFIRELKHLNSNAQHGSLTSKGSFLLGRNVLYIQCVPEKRFPLMSTLAPHVRI